MNNCVICGEICSKNVALNCPLGGDCSSSCELFLEEKNDFTNKVFVRVGKTGYRNKDRIDYER